MKIVFFEHWILKNISTNKSSIQSLISRNGTEVSEGKFLKKTGKSSKFSGIKGNLSWF